MIMRRWGVQGRLPEINAFRQLTLELHPDHWPDEDAARRFQRITQAYDVLGDAAKRLAYDQTMERWGTTWRQVVRHRQARGQPRR